MRKERTTNSTQSRPRARASADVAATGQLRANQRRVSESMGGIAAGGRNGDVKGRTRRPYHSLRSRPCFRAPGKFAGFELHVGGWREGGVKIRFHHQQGGQIRVYHQQGVDDEAHHQQAADDEFRH